MSNEKTIASAEKVYTRAKTWQVFCYSCAPTVGNLFLVIFTLNAYIAKGGFGLATALAASVVSAGKIVDAITDPIFAVIVAKINTKKYGAARPVLLVGLALLVFSVAGVMWIFPGKGLIPYVFCYMTYIVGRTIHNQGKNIATNIFTNDPKQRPLIGRYSQIYMMVISTILSLYRAKVLFPKYGKMSFEMMQDLGLLIIVVCVIMDILAIIALKDSDTYENVAAHHKPGVKVSLLDMFGMLRHNSAMLTGVISDASDKLANEVASAAVVTTLVFGVLIGNYGFSGDISVYQTIATIVTVFFITGMARKVGSGKAYLRYTWIATIVASLMFVFFLVFDYTKVGAALIPTVIFVILYSLLTASKTATTSCVVAMYHDIADYEFYLTGKHEPGLVVATITMAGKIVSAAGGIITALLLGTIGYVTTVPQPGDPATPKVFWITMLMWLGMMILGWVTSIIAMRWYPLSAEKMVEIQQVNAQRKAENIAAQKAAQK